MPARRPSPNYARDTRKRAGRVLWRIVEGVVVDVINSHPEWFTDTGRQLLVGSITKRLTGNLVAHFFQLRKEGRRDGSGRERASQPARSTGSSRLVIQLGKQLDRVARRRHPQTQRGST